MLSIVLCIYMYIYVYIHNTFKIKSFSSKHKRHFLELAGVVKCLIIPHYNNQYYNNQYYNQALHHSCQFKKMPLVLGRKTFNFKKPKVPAKQTLRLIQHLPACNSKQLAIIQLIVNNKIFYFLSMRVEQSDWLIRLSQWAVFLHPARCEMQPARCEMQPARCEIQLNLCEKFQINKQKLYFKKYLIIFY